jgi:hypothetical protein
VVDGSDERDGSSNLVVWLAGQQNFPRGVVAYNVVASLCPTLDETNGVASRESTLMAVCAGTSLIRDPAVLETVLVLVIDVAKLLLIQPKEQLLHQPSYSSRVMSDQSYLSYAHAG